MKKTTQFSVVKPTLLVISVLLVFLCGIIQPEYIVAIQIVLLLFAARKVRISQSFIALLLILVLHTGICVLLGRDTIFLAVKQLAGIIVSYLFYKTIVKNKDDALDALLVYKKFTIIIAVFALVQQVAFYAHISVIYDLRWLVKGQLAPANSVFRASTIFQEPSECALILLPMAFMAMYLFGGKSKQELALFISKKEAIIILLGYVATFSSAGYIGIFIGVIFIWLEYKHNPKQIIIFILGIAAFMIAYTKIGDFNERINDTLALISDDSQSLATANISSQTIIINLKIALKSFADSCGLGGGIGSHPISYERFIKDLPVSNVVFFFNKEDANSLLLRIISELGLLGLAGVVGFLFRFWPKRDGTFESIVGNMCITYFFLRLLRYGHYFNNGLLLFVIVFILMKKEDEGNVS